MKTYHVCILCNKPIAGGGILIEEREGDAFAHSICVRQLRILIGVLLRRNK